MNNNDSAIEKAIGASLKGMGYAKLRQKVRIFFCAFLMSVSVTSHAEVLWKPDQISFELNQAHPMLEIGLVLELEQVLEPGEYGWRQSRMDVPDDWNNAKLAMVGDSIVITIEEASYYINAKNKGLISFEILDGGRKTDSQLLEIWTTYATKK